MNIDTKTTEKMLLDFVKDVATRVQTSDFNILAKIARELINAKYRGNMIFTVGNGGSASTAGHLVNDLSKGCRVWERNGFPSICLNDPNALVTCLANDFSYDVTYSMMLKALGHPGDVLVVFSGSGNSPSTVNPLKLAREMGLTTIGFGGRDGGKMKDYCDLCLIAPTDSMEKLEDMHMMYCHSLVCIMRELLKNVWDIEAIFYPDPNKTIKKALFNTDFDVKGMKEFKAALVSKGVDCIEASSFSKESKSGDYTLYVTTDPAFAKKAKDSGGYLLCVAGTPETGDGIDLSKRDLFHKNGAGAIVPSFENVRMLMKFFYDNSDKKEWS